ncbi:MAG TPA: sensor histidine kinase [Aestuariivirga sp.]|nr:sensor histidine kinase [Aestuariivirga sp.]
MRERSLALRLTLTSALMAALILAAAGLLLGKLFNQALERNFDARLAAVMDGLIANVEVSPEGAPVMNTALADTRFSLPLSGWYWEVTPPAGKGQTDAVSGSLLETRLVPTPAQLALRDRDGVARFHMTDSEGKALRVIERRFKLFGGAADYSFLVAGNFDELKAERRAFHRALSIVLSLLGLGLLAAVFFQVRFGLKPLQSMETDLAAIRSGSADSLHGDYPSEIQPVADELNLLIKSNTEIVDRARTQVGNLAHALKTPLSVLANEARDSKTPLARKVMEQTRLMGEQVALYLDRARRAARAQTIGAVTPVDEVLAGLARTLERIHRDRAIIVDLSGETGLRFRGERQDFEEMAGNLMDNACKWAKARVDVTMLRAPSADGRHWLVLRVEDDGPGIPAAERAEAMKRGRRLDESKAGSGLGLSIVTETAAMYGGTLELAESAHGGLRADLRLPAVV